ncbi:formate dehydrogenase accessory sulfurtransferase FdhD [Thermococcus sp. M39]|uniref:formate dehydrogenase accessory sulfurtransferase FdhD n=1 Tax=unclassified Thermococcus TaxID=2627626 RepID=UPI00143B8EB3|nr:MULTISPECIES: formate dehydrogenase accessory sulfurtransferase FdhD [unclassified Thermococcus]NJE08036.1 formate dehydrogenase accessory sulfurtransferase FdhD [Thermococcus sp. M39]NJE11529.1 formate dehydrogenase accessory sulfurtransferase FdhD [Thermococcus sp. LS2]
MIKKVRIFKWENGLKALEDYVCIEEKFEIYIVYDGFEEFLAELPASPNQLRELGAGFVVCEGYEKAENILDSWVEGERIYVKIRGSDISGLGSELTIRHTPCGDPYKAREGGVLSRKAGDIKVSPELILRISSSMTQLAETWRKTGGTHWAALFDKDGRVLAFSEDIGRHNAVDKVVGYAVLNGLELSELILASSGRMPYGMAKKVVNAGIPIVITKSPPTDKGVELARKHNVTLIGFARGKRFNIYGGEHRIASETET